VIPQDRKVKQVVWGLVPVRGGEDVRKGCRRMNTVESYIFMYENRKMRPVEIALTMRVRGIKENDGGG
jgi:hypothetical protein